MVRAMQQLRCCGFRTLALARALGSKAIRLSETGSCVLRRARIYRSGSRTSSSNIDAWSYSRRKRTMATRESDDLSAALDRLEQSEHSSTLPEAALPALEYQSPTLASLDAKRRPDPLPICAA